MTTKTFKERCYAESTRDVIFLLQWRNYIVIAYPSGYDNYGDGVCKSEDFDPDCDEDYGEDISCEQLANITQGDFDIPCALETWETESVFLSREEAEEFGNARSYRFRDGWRVYGTTSEGELAELIKAT